jgi:diguanylate cyclase (GGDEF)-like protein
LDGGRETERRLLDALSESQCFATIDVAARTYSLEYLESVWRFAVDGGPYGVWDFNRRTETFWVSAGWKRMRGLDPILPFNDFDELWHQRLHPEDTERTLDAVHRLHSGESPYLSLEYREKRTDGAWVHILAQGKAVEWDEDRNPIRFVGMDLDITKLKIAEAKREQELGRTHRQHLLEIKKAHRQTEIARQKADFLSRVDALSGLANRRAFTTRVEELLKEVGSSFSLVLVDVDHFKQINDRHGHKVGDEVIREFSRRLSVAAGESSFVARLGGDEFGLVIPDGEEGQVCQTEVLLDALAQSFARPFMNNDEVITLSGSIGVARFPEHAATLSELLSCADLALYEAKSRGRRMAVIYDEDIGSKAAREFLLAKDIKAAFAQRHIVPFFQPIYNLRSKDVVAFEVLARWQHPSLGTVLPDEFIPIATRLGLASDLTKAVLTQALEFVSAIPEHIGLSVNLSADEMCDPASALRLMQMLREHRIDPSRLQIEITEKALMQDIAAASRAAEVFRKSGARLVLDDFGKGYSGLCYLRELVLDGVKVDGAFVVGLEQGNQAWKVLNGIGELARSLSLNCVVEGLEDETSIEICCAMGFHFGQGYGLGRPQRAADAADMLAKTLNQRQSA